MKMKTLLASLAVAGLAFAQPVAAATRSSDSLPSRGVQPSTTSVERTASLGDQEAEELKGNPLLLIIAIFGTLAILIALLSDGKSPG